MLVPFLKETISMAITYLFGSTGETVIEKGGNLGIPGIMCLGALGGVLGVNTYITIFSVENIMGWLLILFAIFGSFIGAIPFVISKAEVLLKTQTVVPWI